MPIQGYTPNRNLIKIEPGSVDYGDWVNQNADTLDTPVLIYQITAAEAITAGQIAVIKDDGAGVKKAYLATSANYTTGDPLGAATETATAGTMIRLALCGKTSSAAYAFGTGENFVYLADTGDVTTTPTATKIGYAISSTSFYFSTGASSSGASGQTNTVTAQNGLQNTGDNVNATLSPIYGTTANTICAGNDSRLHTPWTDPGTTATSFEINYTANSANLMTTGLTANRNYTFPDATTKLLGEGYPATVTAQYSFSPATAQAPFTLGANAQGQLVTGFNADKLDGQDAAAFASASHTHPAYFPFYKADGSSSPISLTGDSKLPFYKADGSSSDINLIS